MAKAAELGYDSILHSTIGSPPPPPPYRVLIAPTAFQQIQLIRENESIALCRTLLMLILQSF
jgi:hypothetical protein